tara:strand:- start:365 stop:856 length:492 start_codon:yes stop_codon:yes gene_type:complete
MQSYSLKTFTANFDPQEDRIRLDCDLHIEEQAQIFFTQRLGRLFVLELVRAVEEMSVASSSNDLQTKEKLNSNEIKEPVGISSKRLNIWLINTIDFEKLEDGLRIIFKDNKQHAVHIEGGELLLRNILNVFFKMFYIAEWNTDCFPAWIEVKTKTESQSVTIH